MALNRSCERRCILEQKIVLNYKLLDWITSIMKDMIESTIEDTPEEISTLIAVNNMLNQLDTETMNDEMTNLISETLINKIFDEIKNGI